MSKFAIDSRDIGSDEPCYIVAEIGINHNGKLELARDLIDVAVAAGCDAVKFQKRTPEICVPEDQKEKRRETPWGNIPYIEYKRRIEFGEEEYRSIDQYCEEREITWFASAWDLPSLEFLTEFDVPCHKIASPMLTNDRLLDQMRETGTPIILSTGMSTREEIDRAVNRLGTKNLLICHSTSAYPCKPEELNLRMIETLDDAFPCPVGYSGHEVGLQTTYAAVTLGACLVERHITLDRAMWGSDQAASVEPQGLMRLTRDIRVIEKALGDGEKKVYDSEMDSRNRLRKFTSP